MLNLWFKVRDKFFPSALKRYSHISKYKNNNMNIYILFTLFPVHIRVGRENLVLRYSVPHFLPNSGGQLWRSCTRCDCKTDWLRVRSPLEDEIFT